jgi:tripartite-type tricarboxylate transporter receptor subunit TctC
MFAPAATPPEIVARLHDEMKKVMADPELRKKISDLGLIPVDTPPIDGIRTYIKSEQEKWGSLVRKLGLEATQ